VTDRVLLQAALDASRAAVLRRYKPESCIATTRVTIEVLRHFGVRAAPWPVNVSVFTEAAWDLARQGVPIGEWPPGAWSVGIHVDASPDRVGHLAAIAGGYLLDGSIDQAARPEKGIHALRPLVARLPDPFVPDDTTARIPYQVEGLVLIYFASGSRVFRSSRSWRPGYPLVRACVAEAIRAVHGSGPR
jgi:hypothetical protein